jgi:hypothetical protein
MKSTNRLLIVVVALQAILLANIVHSSPSPARRSNNFASNTIVSPPSDVEDVDLSTIDWTPSQGSTNARQIYVGTAGDVKVTLIDGGVATYHNWPAGVSKSMLVTRIWKTGTTATQLEAEY